MGMHGLVARSPAIAATGHSRGASDLVPGTTRLRFPDLPLRSAGAEGVLAELVLEHCQLVVSSIPQAFERGFLCARVYGLGLTPEQLAERVLRASVA